MERSNDSARRVQIRTVDRTAGEGERTDSIAVEEPLGIRVTYGPAEARVKRSVSMTMRTPGSDFDLAVGFMWAEGLIGSRADVVSVEYCGRVAPGLSHSNVVMVELTPESPFDPGRLQRNFLSTSSCGVCGKASIEALDIDGHEPLDAVGPDLTADVIHAMPEALRERQALFDTTGGLHAAGLFDASGDLIACAEDVGRHNAVDKLVGAELLADRLPASELGLILSGRTSYELIQKALVAGIGVVMAVGAPSSLAVEMAERFGLTLIGFLRDDRFNVYCGAKRIRAGGGV